jgi:hypothetical protein
MDREQVSTNFSVTERDRPDGNKPAPVEDLSELEPGANSPGVAGSDVGIKIDPEFESLNPPLAAHELGQLERNLLREGRCREPLVIWKPYNILVDGHNRFKLCQKHDLPYDRRELEFGHRDNARNWIIANQLGRRNLTRLASDYFIGERYNAEKKARGGTGANQHKRRSKGTPGQNGKSCHSATAAGRLAQEYRRSERSVRGCGALARAVNRIAKTCGLDARQWILSQDAKVTQKQIQEVSALTVDQQRKALHELMTTGTWGRPESEPSAQGKTSSSGRHRATRPRAKAAGTGAASAPPPATPASAPPNTLVLTMPAVPRGMRTPASKFYQSLGRQRSMAFHRALAKIIRRNRPR